MALSADRMTVIRAGGGAWTRDLRELWARRDLVYFLIWRDVRVRYRQTVLGASWAVLQPFLTMVAFSILFGRLAGVSSEGAPYPIFAYAGLLPWQLFAQALTQCANSLVASQHLITKVYFPRTILPVAAVLSGLVDFLVAFAVLLGLMVYYGIAPTPRAVVLPVFVLLALATALGLGTWLAALNVKYRDVRHTIPFLLQFWLFVTPVAYPGSLIPEAWRVVYWLNPMAGAVEGFRWALLGASAPGDLLGLAMLAGASALIGGMAYFRRVERSFADLV